MIVLPALKAIPWRLIGYGVALGAFVLLFWRINVWHTACGELRSTQERLEAEQGCEPGSMCAARVAAAEVAAAAKQSKIDAEVLSGYQTGLETVAAYAAAHPAPSVRLCRPTNRTEVRVPGSPGPADGSAGSGDVSLEAGKDIGQQLFDLADEADREALKLRYLQNWNRALAAD